MDTNQKTPTTLIAIAGFPGSGKSTISKRLSTTLGIPRLGSDFFGRTIRKSKDLLKDESKAYWLAYDLMFGFAQDQLSRGVSIIIDTNFGWQFQWDAVDEIIRDNPRLVVIPILLQADKEVCKERIAKRHLKNPHHYDPPEVYESPKIENIGRFLDDLSRPGMVTIDANRELDLVFQSVLDAIQTKWTESTQIVS